MKKILAVFCSFFALFFIGAQTVFADVGTIKITSPNGGETFNVGDTVNITWEAPENIDSMYIGWSTGPGSLNWIATGVPNTGSYSWKVNVGNTTNTQFQISITGYDTGSGSSQDRSDGYFTVNGANPVPSPSPVASPSPITTTTQTTQRESKDTTPPSFGTVPALTKTEAVQPLPTPIPVAKPKTAADIELPELFEFEGSQTTDLSQVEDLSSVADYTLDTETGFMFIFEDELDFTDPEVIEAFSNLEEYWVVEFWYIYIEIEWWIEYEVTSMVTVSYENEALTSFAPVVIQESTLVSESEEKVVATNSGQATSPKELEVSATETGEITFSIDQAGPVTIVPRLELSEVPSEVSSSQLTLEGLTSHADAILSAKLNGQPVAASFSEINQETGAFTVGLENLVPGANFIQIYSQLPNEEPVLVYETTITFSDSWWSQISFRDWLPTFFKWALSAVL